MKKLFILAITLLLTSCAHDVNQSTGMNIVEYMSVTGGTHGFISDEDRGKVGTIREFRYKGHEYIQFDIITSHNGRCGIVHNPDCPCYDSVVVNH